MNETNRHLKSIVFDMNCHHMRDQIIHNNNLIKNESVQYVHYGPYIKLKSGAYQAIVIINYIDNCESIRFDVCSNNGLNNIGSRTSFVNVDGGCVATIDFIIFEEEENVELRILAKGISKFQLLEYQIFNIISEYKADFCFVVKSFQRDLDWAFSLYRSVEYYVRPVRDLYLVVPEKDVGIFFSQFSFALYNRIISKMPIIVSEEDIFSMAKIKIPDSFDGWKIQQLVKLGFAFTGLSRYYCTLDSAMLFTRHYRWDNDLFVDSRMVTAAEAHDREERKQHYNFTGEQGWLNNNLVNIAHSFEYIENFFGNSTQIINHYISTNGFFDSRLVKELENWSRNYCVDGVCGLISIAPYEFAWYGSYVANIKPEFFIARSPHLCLCCHSNEHASQIAEGKFVVPEPYFGITFQPPASDMIVPDAVYNAYVSN